MLGEAVGVCGPDRRDNAAPIASTKASMLLAAALRRKFLIMTNASFMGL